MLDTIFKKYEQTTDKDTLHSYVSYFYKHHLEKYRYRKNIIFEIGVLDGGSIKAWNDYFANSEIYCIDIFYEDIFKDWLSNQPRVKGIQGDAYNAPGLDQIPGIDIFIDDGPHTLESQLISIDKFLPKINKGGIFIIEDIQNDKDMFELYNRVPDSYKKYTYPVDLRFVKNRYDDRLLVIEIPE